MKFNTNMGKTDRMVRVAVAAIFIGLIVAQIITGVLAIVAGVIAAIFLVTSVIKFCPLYTIFGFSTSKSDSE